MTKAIRIHETGGPDVLTWEDVDVARPGPDQVRIRQSAVGLNYIDVYLRTGLYPLPELPAVIGMEGAGVVEETGAEVTEFKPGDRVCYPMNVGGYAGERLIDAGRLLHLPDGIGDTQAAAMMLKGMTAHYLLRRTYRVQPDDPVLVYAAAGGVGLILCQWAKHLGATVIGCVGSAEKAALARAHGCDHAILYDQESVPERVREITGGEGVAVAYDAVGKATFEASLDSLRPFGVMVSFGAASGPVEPFSPAILSSKGSLYVTRPTLATHTATRKLLLEGAEALFDMVLAGHVKIEIGQTYPLEKAAQAHRDLQARKTTGSTVLIP